MISPKHREAYARLDIRKVKAGCESKRIYCRYLNEGGAMYGEVFILEVHETELILGFTLGGPYFKNGEGTISLRIEHVPDPVNREGHVFRCPDCNAARKTLFFNGRWSCADCHGLKFRSQMVPRDVQIDERKLDRRDKLRKWLANGRPHRMRQATYKTLKRELYQLDAWAKGNRPKVASAQHRYRIRDEWIELKDLREALWHSDYIVRDNRILPAPWRTDAH